MVELTSQLIQNHHIATMVHRDVFRLKLTLARGEYFGATLDPICDNPKQTNLKK